MKIVHCLNFYLPGQVAGTEVYVHTLIKNVVQTGTACFVVVPNYGSSETSSYDYDGVRVIRYAEPSVVDRELIMGRRQADGLQPFVDVLRLEDPDVVHFHELAGSNGISLNHVVAAKQLNKKVLITFHVSKYSCATGNLVHSGQLCDGKILVNRCSRCYLESTRGSAAAAFAFLPLAFYSAGWNTLPWKNKAGTALGTGFLVEQIKRRLHVLADHCDKLVVLTEWYRNILLLNGVKEEKIVYIPQGSTAEPRKIEGKDKIAKLPVRLMFLGRIAHYKGLHLLVEAIKNFRDDQLALDVYGQSTNSLYETALREKTMEMRNVHWRGILPKENLMETMQQYDALCLCSTFSEMSPLVIQEAFASGLPVIASKVHGNVEQIRNGENGLLYDFNDVHSLTQQLRRCINDPALLLTFGKNIRTPRSFQQIGKEYLLLYESLFSPNNRTLNKSLV